MIAVMSAGQGLEVKVLAGAKTKFRICPVFVVLANYYPQIFSTGTENQLLDAA